MTDTKRLLEAIERSGLRKGFIASKLGITTYGFQKKVEKALRYAIISL